MRPRCTVLICMAWLTAAPASGQIAPPASDNPKPAAAVDLYGDPLPPGAVARLGTVRFRRTTPYFVKGLAFLDNDTIVTASGREVQLWEATTGRLKREVVTAPVTVQSF